MFLVNFVCTVWFGITGAAALIALSIAIVFLNLLRSLGILSSSASHGCVRVTTSCLYGALMTANPQFKFVEDCPSLSYDAIKPGAIILVNHNSKFDVFLSSLCPRSLVRKATGVYKASLGSVPVLGAVFRCAGHFPVYFTSSDPDKFSVEKDKQALVNEALEEFLASREGHVIFSPEGLVNRRPDTLRPFRHGMFQLCLKHKVPIFAIVHTGGYDAWPVASWLGGRPATIRWRFVEVAVDYGKVTDGAVLAEYVQSVMQGHVTELII